MYVFQKGNEIFGPININGRIPSRFRKGLTAPLYQNINGKLKVISFA